MDHLEEHDLGLSHDLPVLLGRRRLLGLLGGGLGLAALTACGSSPETASPTATSGAAATEIPEETGGPYPADGSNGVNVLTETGIVRSDLTSSFGSSTTRAAGIPLTIALTVLDVSDGGRPMTGAAVYLWHADRDGRYSMYDAAVRDENYLRGVQAAGPDGAVTFTSVFPACYDGRWPHVHLEVYPSVEAATTATARLRTTQLALPKAACDAVYATTGYETSVGNLSRTSLDSDMVFRDGYSLQLASVTGSTASGLTAALTVPV